MLRPKYSYRKDIETYKKPRNKEKIEKNVQSNTKRKR